MKTQQDWMDFFNKRNVTTNILSMPAARVSLSACDIWDIQSDAVEDLKAERDELRNEGWNMNRLDDAFLEKLANELSATKAELEGADKVIANLKAERDELRKCLEAFLTTKRDNAHWIDKAMALLSK